MPDTATTPSTDSTAASNGNSSATPAAGSSANAKTSTTFCHAWIKNVDTDTLVVECMFNPKAYTFSKSNSWSKAKVGGKNVPQLEFGGGENATLQVQLYFDTYLDNQTGDPVDVRKKYTDKLWQLMMVSVKKDERNKKARPPRVQFLWGGNWKFEAYIKSMSQKFTLFAPNGTPVRAVVDITFQQVTDESLIPPQNPTSVGVGGERVWSVTEGETLNWIAYKCYDDPSQWRVIADANQMDRVRQLTPGALLFIPNL